MFDLDSSSVLRSLIDLFVFRCKPVVMSLIGLFIFRSSPVSKVYQHRSRKGGILEVA